MRAKVDILNSSQFPDIRQNYDVGISNFQISGQSFINENYHNSRIGDDIDMKLGPVTKLEERNTATPKKSDNDVISINYDVIVFVPIYGQFAAIWKPLQGLNPIQGL